METKLTLDEMETHASMVASDRSVWEIQTDDPVWIARLDKIATAYKTSATGKWYRLRADQILVRKGKREISEETRAKRAEQLQRMRAKQQT